MNLLEFKKDIQSNKLKPYYIISGEEIGIISFFLKQIKKPTIRSENVLEVWRNLTSKQMISSTGNVYIVRDDDQFMKTEKVWKTAAEKIKYGTLILLITKPNKVTSFYKQNQEHWVEFERQSETQLKKYFSKQYPTLDVAHLATIIEMCNKDFDRIDNELNKISCALKGEMDSVQLPSLARGIIHTEVTYDVFNTLNNLLLKNFNSALMEVNAMLASGESMIGLLTLLYRSFVNGAKVLGSSNQIGRAHV